MTQRFSKSQHVFISSLEHFGELHHVTLRRNQSSYTLPVGEIKPYFSFEKLAHRVSEAQVSDSLVVRHTSVANKWKTIHLLLHPGFNATQIHYNITFQRDDDTEFTMSFSVTVDTRETFQISVIPTSSKDTGKEPKATPTPEPVFPFSDIPEDKRGPKIKKRLPGEPQTIIEVPSVNVSLLPAALRKELQRLEEKLQIGDLTMKGYNLTRAELLKPYKMLAENQQIPDSQPGKGDADEVQKKPYKDLEGDDLKIKDKTRKIQKNQKSKGELSRENASVRDKPVIPVSIDDKPAQDIITETPYPLKAAIERPMTSKLKNKLSPKKSAESEAEAFNAAPVGRRLQHFTSADRGFLPWERRKYFQALLEVCTPINFEF